MSGGGKPIRIFYSLHIHSSILVAAIITHGLGSLRRRVSDFRSGCEGMGVSPAPIQFADRTKEYEICRSTQFVYERGVRNIGQSYRVYNHIGGISGKSHTINKD